MSKITTNDCKLFLLDLYKDKNKVNWKRIRKFKDENGHVCRDFKHLDDEFVTLIEKDGQLSVLLPLNTLDPLQSDSQVDSSVLVGKKTTSFTLFDETQQKSAKRLVNAFVKPKEDPIEPDSSAKGFEAIPNLMSFSFLSDANCDEHEYLEEIANSMQFNAPMRDVVVFFAPTTVKSLCQHVSPLVEPFLTIPLDEVEEMSFKLSGEDTKLSVLSVFEALCLSGFVYNSDGCALKSLFAQYQMLNVKPVIDRDDKTSEFKKAFIAAVKKDNALQVKSLIELGMPLNMRIGKTSLMGHALSENKIECFKYLVTLYENTANIGSGKIDLVWESAWWPNDCTCYLLSSTYYDFSLANQQAHDHLVMAYGHHGLSLESIKDKVNLEYVSLSCLRRTLTYDRFYNLFKDFVKMAIEEYPDRVSSDKELVADLEYGFIIQPILDLLAPSSCLFAGRSVFEIVQSKIDEIGHNPQGYREKIGIYRHFLKQNGH